MSNPNPNPNLAFPQPQHHSPPPPTMPYHPSSSSSFETPVQAQAQAQAPTQAWVQIPSSTPQPPPVSTLNFSPQAPPRRSPAPQPLALQAPVPQAPAPQAPVPPSSSSRQPDQVMHKNRLQEFTHKSNIPLPIYQTVNEGYQHMPQFRSTVLVNGAKFTSSSTFSTRKAAEQNVAELALKSLSKEEIANQGIPLIQEDTVFCKSILNEFATKMNMEMPTYNTIKREGLLPVFVSSLVFNGASYTGGFGKNKKEAEQLAARVAILSLLGDPCMGKLLYDIIKSKVKLYAALHKVDSRDKTHSSTVPLIMSAVQSLGVAPGNDTGVEVAPPVANAPRTTDSVVPTAIINAATSALPDLYSGNVPQKHEFKIQKPGAPSEAISLPASQPTNLPIEFVHSISSHSADAGPSSSKKRRKNKKKANKRLCTGAQLQMAALPLNQVPPCSVAQ